MSFVDSSEVVCSRMKALSPSRSNPNFYKIAPKLLHGYFCNAKIVNEFNERYVQISREGADDELALWLAHT